ncbi:MAG: hypothetical protein FJX46_08335 [Alphaproteobacteria bacterium]|nr:hypothetical protein [Alphaproteobacteria bacterium]
MLGRLIRHFRPDPIAHAAGLFEAIRAEANHIAQKVPMDYVEARAHWFSPQLYTEAMFLDALRICIYESYVAMIGPLLTMTEGRLRAAAGTQAGRVAERLAGRHAPLIAHVPVPPNHPDRSAEAAAAFAEAFAQARTRPPRIPADLAEPVGERMFETLPLHRRFTHRDQDAILATVQFRFTIFNDQLAKRLDSAAVIASLLAEPEAKP